MLNTSGQQNWKLLTPQVVCPKPMGRLRPMSQPAVPVP
jgi:hypothetical protein